MKPYLRWLPLMVLAAMPRAQAQQWPMRPVRLVVGFSVGGPMDVTARMLAPKLAEIWGQPVVIENRAGAGGSIATVLVAQASPDGNTLLVTSASHVINAVLRPNVGYDPMRDFAHVIAIGTSTSVLLVPPALNIKSVKELIALANERPGKILYGSAGAGSGTHMTTERFNMTAGIKGTHVAYKGQAEMIVELLAGRLQFGIVTLAAVGGTIKEGRLRALAVLAPRRSPVLPDVPTVTEILPNFRRDALHHIVAPAKTPRAVINKINKDVARVIDMPEVKKQMEAIDFMATPGTPEELEKTLREMQVTFEQVARAAGLK